MLEAFVMTEKTIAFREQLRQARTDLTKRQAQNARKRAIAIMPRALRDTRGLTQAEAAEAAGMTQSMIARLEALSGPVSGIESIERYVGLRRPDGTAHLSYGL
jgi:predicted XRE-type DNA-binding protein